VKNQEIAPEVKEAFNILSSDSQTAFAAALGLIDVYLDVMDEEEIDALKEVFDREFLAAKLKIKDIQGFTKTVEKIHEERIG
jgi:hypothetical protein